LRHTCPGERNQSHFSGQNVELRFFLGSWVERNRVSDPIGPPWIHDIFLETYGYPKEGWESLFLVIAISPTFFLGAILPDLIDFLRFLERRFKKFVDDVVIFDPNACCSLDEDETNGIGGISPLIHEPRQLIGG
jgi:hypothetical protein